MGGSGGSIWGLGWPLPVLAGGSWSAVDAHQGPAEPGAQALMTPTLVPAATMRLSCQSLMLMCTAYGARPTPVALSGGSHYPGTRPGPGTWESWLPGSPLPCRSLEGSHFRLPHACWSKALVLWALRCVHTGDT